MVVSGGTFSGYVAAQVPENVEKIYSDQAVRKMFATVALRKEVPVEEQLDLLPFKLTELSSFKMVRTLAPGAAILLSDAETENDIDSKAFLIINLIGRLLNDRTIAAGLRATSQPRSQTCAMGISPCRSRSGSMDRPVLKHGSTPLT